MAQDPRLQASAGQSWDLIRQAVQERVAIAKESALLDGRGSRAAGVRPGGGALEARGGQAHGPAGDRLPHRPGCGKGQGRAHLFRPAEPRGGAGLLAQGLQEALDGLGPAHPIVAALLEGRSPRDRARALVTGTRLLDPAARAALAQAAPPAVRASADPMVALARKLEVLARPYLQSKKRSTP